MPSWDGVLEEIRASNRKDALDFVRRKYIEEIHKKTGRNVICYYSGWLSRRNLFSTSINDEDKNAFMNAIHGIDRSKGLDLILHTPGGDVAAAESLVNYLRQMFGTNIRTFVPQLAMSAGTMIACASQTIVMGKQSSLGPIDPQINGIPAHGVVEEFKRAIVEVQKNPASTPVWQAVISKYHPTFIGSCEKAIKLSDEVVTQWLIECMFKGDTDAQTKARRIVKSLNNHTDTKVHARHIHMDECINYGLNVMPLEKPIEGVDLQDAILTVHHAYMHTFSHTDAVKIIENHEGKAIVKNEKR